MHVAAGSSSHPEAGFASLTYPDHLGPELKRMKAQIVEHLLEENFRRLSETFNLKPVTREGMTEITNGQPWRILNTRPQSEWKTRYRWERVHHDGECDSGAMCSRCYPYHMR